MVADYQAKAQHKAAMQKANRLNRLVMKVCSEHRFTFNDGTDSSDWGHPAVAEAVDAHRKAVADAAVLWARAKYC